MRLALPIALTLSGLSLTSAAAVVAPRSKSSTTILSDIAAVNVAVGYNLGNITLYEGGLNITQLESILMAGNLVTATLNTSTIAVKASGKFTAADSTKILASMKGVEAKILSVLSELNTKEPLFSAAGLAGILIGTLNTHGTEETALYSALEAKAQAKDVPSYTSLQNSIQSAYVYTTKLYNATTTTSSKRATSSLA